MKKLLMTALIAGISAAPALATPYVSGSLGLGFSGNSDYTTAGGTEIKDSPEWKFGVPFGAAVGIKQADFRIEAALGYQSHDVDKWRTSAVGPYETPASTQSMSALTYMVNGYYDINLNKSSVSPYVMAGLGGATLNPAGTEMEDRSTTVFAWQLGAGVGIQAAKNLTLDLGIRYLKPGEYKESNGGTCTLSYTNILAGIRYEFH
ncbi:MAG: porin family protein [Chlorobium sp.]|nr:MAG: porin family protein [Chlorobium sp.]